MEILLHRVTNESFAFEPWGCWL